MTKKTVIILTIFFQLFVGCKDNLMEIHDGYLTLSNDEKINALAFDTRKNLYDFYTSICADYCKQINIKNYAAHYAEFICYNEDWYKDTIFIKSEESTCVPLKGDKYTSVFLTFYDKNGLDILKSNEMNYIELKKYFNDSYIETAK